MSNLRAYDESYPAYLVTPVPVVSGLAPATAVINTAPVTVTVTGSAFSAGSVVTGDGVSVPTTYVSPTSLTAVVTPGPTARTIVVRVKTAGVVSTGSRSFTVTATTRRASSSSSEDEPELEEDEEELVPKRGPGRPKGSKNRPRSVGAMANDPSIPEEPDDEEEDDEELEEDDAS